MLGKGLLLPVPSRKKSQYLQICSENTSKKCSGDFFSAKLAFLHKKCTKKLLAHFSPTLPVILHNLHGKVVCKRAAARAACPCAATRATPLRRPVLVLPPVPPYSYAAASALPPPARFPALRRPAPRAPAPPPLRRPALVLPPVPPCSYAAASALPPPARFPAPAPARAACPCATAPEPPRLGRRASPPLRRRAWAAALPRPCAGPRSVPLRRRLCVAAARAACPCAAAYRVKIPSVKPITNTGNNSGYLQFLFMLYFRYIRLKMCPYVLVAFTISPAVSIIGIATGQLDLPPFGGLLAVQLLHIWMRPFVLIWVGLCSDKGNNFSGHLVAGYANLVLVWLVSTVI